jgi:hypothetical protein
MNQISAALDIVAEGLKVDGYEFKIHGLDDGTLRVEIAAGESACEECLVSKDLMSTIIMGNLPQGGPVERVDITYPPGYKGP